MENASKALLMGAGVLLAILVLSVGVLLYNNFREPTESYVAKLDATELKKYNAPFEVYISRTDVTAQEIVSVVSESQQKGKNIKVSITNISGYGDMQEFTSENINYFLNENLQYIEAGEEGTKGKLVYYKCTGVTYDENTGTVNTISFEKIGDTIVTPPPDIEEPDPTPVPPEKDDDDDDPVDPNNGMPEFKNLSGLSTNVVDPDGDWTRVYAEVYKCTFPEGSWKAYAQFINGNGPEPEGTVWTSVNYKPARSKEYEKDYSSSKYTINFNLVRYDWKTIYKVKYYAQDKYHGDEWIKTDFIYVPQQCNDYHTTGGTTETVTEYYESDGSKTITHYPDYHESRWVSTRWFRWWRWILDT